MPAKRRASKRRRDPTAEAARWATLFACGYDFFGDLDDLGFPREASDPGAAARAAAPEVWARLGRIFLDRDMGADFNCGTLGSWALKEFGQPD